MLNKQFLKGLGIDDDKIGAIMDEHGNVISGLTEKRDDLQKKLDAANAEVARLTNVEKDLVKANAKLEDAKETETKLNNLQKEFDDYKADITAKEEKADKSKLYKELLNQAGIPDKRHNAILRVTDLDAVKVKDGKLENVKELTESIKNDWSDFIVTTKEAGAKTPTPPDNNGGNTFEKMSLADKMTYANEHPNDTEVQAWLK